VLFCGRRPSKRRLKAEGGVAHWRVGKEGRRGLSSFRESQDMRVHQQGQGRSEGGSHWLEDREVAIVSTKKSLRGWKGVCKGVACT